MDKYLLFHTRIHYLHTEQFGGFLNAFMEMICIARKLGRILVLPNIYVAPRDDKMCEEDPSSIYIDRCELLDIRHFIDTKKLGELIPIISMPSFLNLVSRNKELVTTALVPQGDDTITPYQGGACIHTTFGTIPVTNRIQHNVNGLHILPILARDDAQSIMGDVLIVCNYQRSNQLFILDPQYEYRHIRNHITFPRYLVQKARSFYEEHLQDAIGVHWRRGDYVTTQYQHEEDTRQFYDNIISKGSKEHVVKLLREQSNPDDTIFLTHNSGNISDIEYIKDNLSDRKIVEYSSDDHMSYVTTPLICIILLSLCSKQIHFSGSSYLRMSNFGRIAIEESLRLGLKPEIIFGI